MESRPPPPEELEVEDSWSFRRLTHTLYGELHALARRYLADERRDHVLSPTALVHEMWLRIGDRTDLRGIGRPKLLRAAARSMRRILVDHARERKAVKRGGDWKRVSAGALEAAAGVDPVDILLVEEALIELAQLNGRQAEIVEMKFFGGMTTKEIAVELEISERTTEADWSMAKTWLRWRMDVDSPNT